MDKILIVDDSIINRDILKDILKEDYEVVEAENGDMAIEILKTMYKDLSLILLDIYMPGLTGYDVLDYMNKSDLLKRLPVIVMSGDNSQEVELNSLALKATDFIRKPFDELVVKRRVKNTIDLYNYKKNLEDKVEEQTKRIHKQYEILLDQNSKIKNQNDKIIELLAVVVEYRDVESGNHIQRIKGYTNALAKQVKKDYPELKITDKYIETITNASVLHDIGKIAIPDSILLKPGRLTKEEFEVMKTHTTKGAEILNFISNVLDKDFAEASLNIATYHHERIDGRGYPKGLVGDEIPLCAQIVSVADVYDALVTKRVYKDAYSHEEATKMIIAGECGTFSKELLASFKNVCDEFETIASNNR